MKDTVIGPVVTPPGSKDTGMKSLGTNTKEFVNPEVTPEETPTLTSWVSEAQWWSDPYLINADDYCRYPVPEEEKGAAISNLLTGYLERIVVRGAFPDDDLNGAENAYASHTNKACSYEDGRDRLASGNSILPEYQREFNEQSGNAHGETGERAFSRCCLRKSTSERCELNLRLDWHCGCCGISHGRQLTAKGGVDKFKAHCAATLSQKSFLHHRAINRQASTERPVDFILCNRCSLPVILALHSLPQNMFPPP